MQFRVEAPRPPTLEEKAWQIVKSAIKIFFLFAFIQAIGRESPFVGVLLVIAGMAFLLRRLHPPQVETVEEISPETPQNPPESAFLGIPVPSPDLGQLAQPEGLWLAEAVRVKHLYVIGKTRTGK